MVRPHGTWKLDYSLVHHVFFFFFLCVSFCFVNMDKKSRSLDVMVSTCNISCSFPLCSCYTSAFPSACIRYSQAAWTSGVLFFIFSSANLRNCLQMNWSSLYTFFLSRLPWTSRRVSLFNSEWAINLRPCLLFTSCHKTSSRSRDGGAVVQKVVQSSSPWFMSKYPWSRLLLVR